MSDGWDDVKSKRQYAMNERNDVAAKLAARERELAEARDRIDVLMTALDTAREESRIYREQRDAVTAEMATLRERVGAVRKSVEALTTYPILPVRSGRAFLTVDLDDVRALLAREGA